MRARGETALYEAIKAGIEKTTAAPGGEDAIRGVVVLTDGLANICQTSWTTSSRWSLAMKRLFCRSQVARMHR